MTKSLAEDNLAKSAKHGERMLEVRVRFWTNDIAEGDGYVIPGHGWSSGVVRMERNETHGIVPSPPIPFGSLMELPHAIERALIANKVVLHDARERKYMAPPPKGTAAPRGSADS